MKTRGEIQQFTNLIYNTQFQKVNVLSILKDISMTDNFFFGIDYKYIGN
jgi:hypothetical protein